MRSSFAIASVLAGLFCFLNLFGLEKGILAIILGVLAINEIRNQEFTGRNWAILGIILGLIYIILIIALLPYLLSIISI